jgi:hypothetical protein
MIVEDIEKIDFDFFEWHSGEVFEEWHTPADQFWVCYFRYLVTDKWELLWRGFNGFRDHECGELYVGLQDIGHFINVMKRFVSSFTILYVQLFQVLKDRRGYGYYPDKGDDKGKGMRVWEYGHHLPEPWFQYYWKDTYFHQLHSAETYVDPYAHSYDPDYLSHHH